MNIVTCLNEKYVPYAYVLLKSLFMHNDAGKICVYLVIDDIEESKKHILKGLCEEEGAKCVFIDLDPKSISEKIYSSFEWPDAIYYRLSLWNILPFDIDRALYLDGDIIISGDISEFYEQNIEDVDMVVCQDIMSYTTLKDEFKAKHGESFYSLYDEGKYFNSGVILYNLAARREEDMISVYSKAAKDEGFDLPYPDQDVLNLVHYDRVRYDDFHRYNFPAMAFDILDDGYHYDRAKEEISILHFINHKPWEGGNHLPYELERFWWEVAFDTPFADDLMRNYILEFTIGTVRDEVRGLIRENTQLRADLNEAIGSFQKLLKAYESK